MPTPTQGVISAVAILVWTCGAMLTRAEEAASPEPVAPEHGKLNTADATPVDPGKIEVEAAYSYSYANRTWDSDGRSQPRGLSQAHQPGISVTVGAAEGLDFNASIGYPFVRDDDSAGPTRGDAFGDLSVSGRYRFYQNAESRLDMALITGLTIPTGTETDGDELGTSQEFWSLDSALVMSKDWGDWTANAEIGFAMPFGGKRGDARGTLTVNLAAGWQALDWMQPEVELNYSREFIHGGDDSQDLSVTAGLVMPINERLRINAGVAQSIWGVNSDQTTSIIIALKTSF
jgi:hypothetical protein